LQQDEFKFQHTSTECHIACLYRPLTNKPQTFHQKNPTHYCWLFWINDVIYKWTIKDAGILNQLEVECQGSEYLDQIYFYCGTVCWYIVKHNHLYHEPGTYSTLLTSNMIQVNARSYLFLIIIIIIYLLINGEITHTDKTLTWAGWQGSETLTAATKWEKYNNTQ